jgi:peptidoglycan hydrolase-like amidase
VFVSPVSYLRGSPDRKPDGTAYDAPSPWFAWQTKTYTVAQLSAWFASDSRTSVGTLTAIDLRRRGVSGRLIGITLIGTAGSKRVSGDVFRSVFNARKPAADPILRSNNFDVAPIR